MYRCMWLIEEVYTYEIPIGLVVRIPGFHPGGPGSIPGLGDFFFIFPLIKSLQIPKLLKLWK